MKKILLFTTIFFISITISAQNITSKKWTDLFSYNNVLTVKEDHGRIICATENGIFFYQISSGEITKLSKTNGLHEVKISAFDYNPETKIGLVGYQNGSMDVVTPNGITLVVDIPIAQGFNGDKKINHISISGDKAVISVDYGVSIFNLNNKEFSLSCFFVNGGSYTASNEATIINNKVYASTDIGLKSHEIDVTFPVFSTWATPLTGALKQADSETVLAVATTSTVYIENAGSFSPVTEGFLEIQDVVVNSQNIIVTDKERIYTLTTSGNVLSNITLGESCNTANLINGTIYGGTKLSGLKDAGNNIIKPDGPYNNISYKMSILNDQLVVSTGGGLITGPSNRDLGYYHFDGMKWNYPEYFIDNPILFNVVDVEINPAKPSEIYFANHVFTGGEKGIYKMENGVFKKVYKNADSNPYYNRQTGIVFDENNNLIVAASAIENSPLRTGYYVYNPSIDDFDLIPVFAAGGSQKPITKDGLLLIPAPFNGDGGLIMRQYDNNPSNTSAPTKILRTDNGLPANGVVSMAFDKDDDLWIGTRIGLRILSDPFSAINDPNPQAEAVIIEQKGIAEELFRDNYILQIEVDSGNRKWVSVDGGGAYYLSPDGQQTLKHFTKENSPIPSNSITDIKVDGKTGKVYFVTLDGIVVYQGDVADVQDTFGDVLVYPNPVVTANFRGKVTIKGLAMKTNIRIADAAGNLVHQAVARGGFYEWDLNNLRGNRVSSGVYFVLMTNEDGTDKATAKIAVVN